MSAILVAVNQPSQHCYPNLVELAKDRSVIGQVLRADLNYQWMLPAADKWAEQNSDYQEKHNDPHRLPFPDPWQFLLDAPAVSPTHKDVFRAAQSQLKALRRLSSIARDEAKLNTDWLEKMEKARNKREFMHAANKVAAARAKYDLFNTLTQSRDVDPQFRRWGQRQIEKSQMERRKRGKGKGFEPLPRASEVRSTHKLICSLVDWWVRGPNDTPGLMFFRNKALTEFLKFYTCNSNLTPETVKKVRQQLELIPVGKKNHFVWDYSVKAADGNKVKSIGSQRNGNIAFSGCLQAKLH